MTRRFVSNSTFLDKSNQSVSYENFHPLPNRLRNRQGEFAEVSVLMQGWEIKFQLLVNQKQPVKFDMYRRPAIPPEIHERLTGHGYQDLILEKDRCQHFLIPTPD